MADNSRLLSDETMAMETDDELPIVRLLIASDIHAGFAENKEHISSDSFEAFREVLAVGTDSKVDFVLLAGDLFHENHPSRESQLKVVRLLRKYCFREGHPSLDFVSDPTINFQHSDFPVANYLDENLRVSMPIFTIHGNHDDLSGKGLSALDVLHEAGLINLFGKFCDVDQIEVTPILLTRGNTKIALYGIGSQRDDRLARSFAKGRVKFNRPEGDDPGSWFSILVLHQNRPPRSQLRSTKSHLSFRNIPFFFDLVIWGHEHECLIEPDFKYMDPNDSSKGFYIVQPGSTVATASVRGKEFKLKKIPLQTTRQIIVEELTLEGARPTAPKIAKSSVRLKKMPDEPLIIERLNELLENAEATRGPHQPWPPRVRLKVIYSGRWLDIPVDCPLQSELLHSILLKPINGRKWGPSHFADKVANASDMIVVRAIHPEKKAKNVQNEQQHLLANRADDVCSVDEMVNKYYNQCDFKNRLNVLSEIAMGKQLQEYSNTETTTQFKYTAADKALSDSIRTQINSMTAKVRETLHNRMTMSADAGGFEDIPLEQQIAEGMAKAKKKRLVKVTEGNDDPNESIASSFLDRGPDARRGSKNAEIMEDDFDSP
uniref:Double-strand break repair protein n=1 Tax=Globodera pallida TaxID=36090 RepID=A0A183C2F3_GLOPA